MQVVIMLLVMTGVLLSYEAFERNLNYCRFRILIESVLLYVLFYKWWGRLLFEKYTPHTIGAHFHTWSGAIMGLKPHNFVRGLLWYLKALEFCFCNSKCIVGIVVSIWVILFKYNEWRYRTIALELVVCSILLCTGITTSNGHHFSYYTARGMYALNVVFLTVFSFLILSFNIRKTSIGNIAFFKTLPIIFLGFIFAYSCINMRMISTAVVLYGTPYPDDFDYEELRMATFYTEEDVLYYGINESYFDGLIKTADEYNNYNNIKSDRERK